MAAPTEPTEAKYDNNQRLKIKHRHRLIDNTVITSMKRNSGYLWACKKYDADVITDLVAQGYGYPKTGCQYILTDVK